MVEGERQRRTGERVVAWVAALVAGVAVAAGGALWPAPGPEGEAAQVLLRIVASLLVLGLVVVAQLPPVRRRRGLEIRLLAPAAFLAVASYLNFGSLHHGGLVSQHEMFHYFLGSKYFPELGYDGLYLASLRAEQESRPDRPPQRRVRDLSTNLLVTEERTEPGQQAVRWRFRDDRWASFVADHERFLAASPPAWIARLRMDHGYNPTPAWTALARLVAGRLPATPGVLALLASLDFLILGAAFVVVFRSYGARVGCLSLAVFGIGYSWRFYYIGGAFLRTDWLAACMVGIALLGRRRPGLAGALLGYATAARVFPALLLLGPAVVALRELWRGERPRWVLRLGVGFGLVVALGLAAGAAAGRGPTAWLEFARNIERHRELAPPNRLGLENVVRNAPPLLADTRLGGFPPDLPAWTQAQVDALRDARGGVQVALSAALLALLLLALWRARRDEAALLSMAAVYALVPVGCYYWALLLTVPFRGGVAAPIFLLGLSTAMKLVHLATPSETARYAVKALGLALFFAGWLLPDALRTLRDAIAHTRRTPKAPGVDAAPHISG